MNLNCVTLKRKLFPTDSLDVFHTSFLFFWFFIYCSCMFTMFSFHVYDTREEKRWFQGLSFIWSYFYTLISHCLLWLSYEVLALVSMKAFGSSFIFSHLCCIIQLKWKYLIVCLCENKNCCKLLNFKSIFFP